MAGRETMSYETPSFRSLTMTTEIASCGPCLGIEGLSRCPPPPTIGTPCIQTRIVATDCPPQG